MNSQITTLNGKCDELTLVRSDLTKDMESLRIDFTDQIREYARQLDDSVSAKHNLEQVIGHLREEVSFMQFKFDSCQLGFFLLRRLKDCKPRMLMSGVVESVWKRKSSQSKDNLSSSKTTTMTSKVG